MRNENIQGADTGTSLTHNQILRKESLLRAFCYEREVSLPASMTVEASLVLPLFIFFFVNIMALFNIVKVQSDMEAALHQTGNEICLAAFDLRFSKETLTGDDEASLTDSLAGAAGIFYAGSRIRSYLGDGIDKSCVSGGYSGLSYLGSHILAGDDIVDIVVDYKVHPIVSLIGFREFPVESRYYGHAWTGYDLSGGFNSGDIEEEFVYITEHGEAYHRDIGCKYLNPSVRSVAFDELEGLRNKDQGRYYPCEYCAGSVAGGNVFVTNYGNRYHSTVNCLALKRKIYTVPISEVGGRHPCSACGG